MLDPSHYGQNINKFSAQLFGFVHLFSYSLFHCTPSIPLNFLSANTIIRITAAFLFFPQTSVLRNKEWIDSALCAAVAME